MPLSFSPLPGGPTNKLIATVTLSHGGGSCTTTEDFEVTEQEAELYLQVIDPLQNLISRHRTDDDWYTETYSEKIAEKLNVPEPSVYGFVESCVRLDNVYNQFTAMPSLKIVKYDEHGRAFNVRYTKG